MKREHSEPVKPNPVRRQTIHCEMSTVALVRVIPTIHYRQRHHHHHRAMHLGSFSRFCVVQFFCGFPNKLHFILIGFSIQALAIDDKWNWSNFTNCIQIQWKQ